MPIFLWCAYCFLGSDFQVSLDSTSNKQSEPKKSSISGRKPVSAKKGVNVISFHLKVKEIMPTTYSS